MKTLAVIGGVDKRPVVYPLLQCLKFLGKTLVVTDEPAFRRFDDDFSLEFENDNITIRVVPLVTQEVVTETVQSLNEPFEYLVVVSNDFIPQGYERVVALSGVNRGFDFVDTTVGDFPNNEEFMRVFISPTKAKNLEYPKITPTPSLLKYIYNCEDYRKFLPLEDQATVAVVTTLFGKALGLESKTIVKLLARKE